MLASLLISKYALCRGSTVEQACKRKHIIFTYPFSWTMKTIMWTQNCLRCLNKLKTEIFENGSVTYHFKHVQYKRKLSREKPGDENGRFLVRFRGQQRTVKNAMKTMLWMQTFLSIFKKLKIEVFEKALVWTGLKYERFKHSDVGRTKYCRQ